MREPKNQMLSTMEPPLMQLSVNCAGSHRRILLKQKQSYTSQVEDPLHQTEL